MTTKRLVFDLVAFVLVITFLLFTVPLMLNASNTAVNLLGEALIVGLVVGVIAVIHQKLTQTKEDNNEE